MEALQGLSKAEVELRQRQYGKNVFRLESSRRWLHLLRSVLLEPMFILLVFASLLYFILGEPAEGFMMIAAMGFVTATSVYQEVKSSKALEALQQLTEPKVTVVREGGQNRIQSEELVPGDIILVAEGEKVPADAEILQANDCTANEAVITGEAFPVVKNANTGFNLLFQGSIINSGACYARVTVTGNHTVLGRLGKSISNYSGSQTLLQQQIRKLVQKLAIFGFGAFLLIFFFNYLNSGDIAASLLFGLTLAMAALPEEIPVAFSSFMALGAWRMSKRGIIARQPQTIENLGAVSVICLDKTGTITENIMEVKSLYDFKKNQLIPIDHLTEAHPVSVLFYAVLASEKNPFDAMEKAIWEAYRQTGAPEVSMPMIYEYPLQGQPPMMTHIYAGQPGNIVAAKGGAEKIVRICRLDAAEADKVSQVVKEMASKGYRVLGVARAEYKGEVYPAAQEDFNWQFEGLLALYDPPKKNAYRVLQQLNKAGIKVKLLTGDYPQTAMSIAEQVGIAHHNRYITGEAIMQLSKDEMQLAIKNYYVFARMFPDAKLKVIDALKEGGEIVAMSGDGVNDGPAIKRSDIGIAMGKKGTEVARQAADLILTDDDLEKIADAVRQGRKIFSNLKKAVRYIISIHIPIILTASLPLILGWKYPNIFTPIHVIFLELIMGPTCSIFFEREPVEENIMQVRPRSRLKGLFTGEEVLISVVQGLTITLGVLILYYYYMQSTSLETTRTIVFTTLICSNVFLTLVNRSFTENFVKTIRYPNNLVLPLLIISVLFLLAIHQVPFLQNLFGLSSIGSVDVLVCVGAAFLIVCWFEGYKTHLSEVS